VVLAREPEVPGREPEPAPEPAPAPELEPEPELELEPVELAPTLAAEPEPELAPAQAAADQVPALLSQHVPPLPTARRALELELTARVYHANGIQICKSATMVVQI